MKPVRSWRPGSKLCDNAPAYTPEDLLPEFVERPELVDGQVYVVAEQQACGALRIAIFNLTYLASHDAWCSPDGGLRPRRERDLWIPLGEWNGALDRARRRQVMRTSYQFRA